MLRSPTARQWLVLAAVAVVAGGLLVGISPPQAVQPALRPVPAVSSATGVAAAAIGPMPAGQQVSPGSAASAVPGHRPPPGIDVAQWQRLQRELPPAELRRLADYLVWSDALHRFRTARLGGADRSTLAALASAVDSGLTDRLLNREMTAAEARSVKLAVLEATVSDAAQREEHLARWIDKQRPTGAFSPGLPDPRQADFNRRQADLLATARDQEALARELDALRITVFAPAGH